MQSSAAKRVLPHHHSRKESLNAGKSRKEKKVKRSRSISFPFLMAVAFAVAALALLNVTQRVLVSQYSIQNEKLKIGLSEEEESKEELFAEKLALESSQRIEGIARNKLGMIDPPSVEYLIYLDKGNGQDSSQLVLSSKRGKSKNSKE